LVINMDETAIGRHVTGLRGTVARATSTMQAAIDRSSLSDRRTYISFIACITHDATIQALLPQVLLGNHHVFTMQLLGSLGEKVGRVKLWRQQSAWNSHPTMRKWLTVLSKALGAVVQERYVIVVMDVHPSHIDASIFLHVRRCGLRLVYIPAKLTHLLQPCDTHVFSRFKAAFREAWLDQKLQSPDGTISVESWLEVLCRTVETVIYGTNWHHAFLSDGILERQKQMGQKLATALGLDSAVQMPQTLPTAEEAACIYPARMKLDLVGYLTWSTKTGRKRKEVEEGAPSSSSKGPAPPPSGRPFHNGRLVRTLD
jgi:hypothetical protein